MARGWGETLSLRGLKCPLSSVFLNCCDSEGVAGLVGHGMARMGHDGTHGTKSRYKIFKMVQKMIQTVLPHVPCPGAFMEAGVPHVICCRGRVFDGACKTFTKERA